MSNNQVIAQGKTECNFDCYKYNKFSLITLKCMWLPTNHIALPWCLIAISSNWGMLVNLAALYGNNFI